MSFFTLLWLRHMSFCDNCQNVTFVIFNKLTCCCQKHCGICNMFIYGIFMKFVIKLSKMPLLPYCQNHPITYLTPLCQLRETYQNVMYFQHRFEICQASLKMLLFTFCSTVKMLFGHFCDNCQQVIFYTVVAAVKMLLLLSVCNLS